ncbi:amidase family protein [Propionicicella superfundia]|uniref:amidase family protein n=1 Tax=Propionicicella superfundia TaxID=348582 RepID=UPI00040A0CF4|nr:amidase family protein [Propionicicella superfundia]
MAVFADSEIVLHLGVDLSVRTPCGDARDRITVRAPGPEHDGCDHGRVLRSDDLLDLTATDLAARLRSGAVPVAELTAAAVRRIAARDVRLAAFAEVRDEAAREAAALDALPAEEKASLPLFGVPVAVTQDMDVAGSVTTFGGRTMTTPAAADAEVVRRLRAAGAVIVGKTHMAEFGHGPHTEGPWGWTSNPRDLGRSAGGSSGGSAVAVASGLVPVALGTDADGSIRIPAAWTGVYGLKPSRGLVSTSPHRTIWHALGQHGPLARSVADLRAVVDVIAGNVDTDEYRLVTEPAEYESARLRVGWTISAPVPGVTADHASALTVARAAHALQRAGHQVTAKPFTAHGTPLTSLVQADAGIRDTLRTVDHPDRAETRNRQAAAIADRTPRAVLRRALAETDRIAFASALAFKRLDVLLTPVTPAPPGPVRRQAHAGLAATRIGSTRTIAYTSYWNIAGNPALSVPAGTADSGLPRAVQIVGGTGRDDVVLACAEALAEIYGPATIAWPPHGR